MRAHLQDLQISLITYYPKRDEIQIRMEQQQEEETLQREEQPNLYASLPNTTLYTTIRTSEYEESQRSWGQDLTFGGE